ncbi:MAG: non-ribosomal peptide synthetase [Gemmatimonadales bacterium]
MSDTVAERRKELERRLAALSLEMRAEVERESGRQPRVGTPDADAERLTIPRRKPATTAPLSFTQELVWLLEQVNPGHTYNVPRMARLTGPFDVAAFQRAVDALVARHEVLRSTFPDVDGEPRQVVHQPTTVPIAWIDLQVLNGVEREDEMLRRVGELIRRPFDLAMALQLRVSVLALAPEEHVLLLESHHVASDEWSRNIVLRELAALYEGFCTGIPAQLPPLPIQYADYAAWQRESLRGARLAHLLGHWRDQLADAPALLDLPTDRPRGPAPEFAGATLESLLPLDLLQGLRALGREHGVTLFMTLLAAFDVLLARYSGQDDIVVGSPIAGRLLPETQGLVGYFSNTLILRTRTDGDPTFSELLQRVRNVCLGAYEHQEVPFQTLMLHLQRERADRSAIALQVLFTLQDPERESLRFHGATVSSVGVTGSATKSELLLVASEQPGGLRTLVEYRTDLYSPATAARMLCHYHALLAGIVRTPGARISELSLMSDSERIELVEVRNRTEQPLPVDATVHGLFAAQARQTPNGIAVEQGARRLTFAELDASSNRIARRLQRMGVAPGTGVGICLERSPELIASLLGVLKAGGHYVPLDLDYPVERLDFMRQDAGLAVVLARQDSPGNARVVRVDADLTQFADCRDDVVDAGVTPADLAYVIYTSGSTGQPKGVEIRHRSVVNFVHWMGTAFPHGPADVVLQKASVSFDASVWEIFLPLSTGARMVLAPPGAHHDPGELLLTIRDRGVSTAQFVPAHLLMMLEAGGLQECRSLRRIVCGGEALPAELLCRLIAEVPAPDIINLYGPTETTVYSTAWTLVRNSFDSSAPIGRPIANTRVYVLDPHLQPAPDGVPGELFIGGAGVARGYLNRPELTAERFLPDPFAGPGTTMYRTGDQVRWRSDGELEYQGRLDHQVKLRGHRIELGEIESLLAGDPGVAAAAVIVREDVPGDRRLVAYVAPATGARTPHPQVLLERLRTQLPSYMVPGTVLVLDRLPLSANGKLDRAALPAPDAASLVTRAAVPLQGPVEEVVAGVWGDVLAVPVAVADSNFFELGGHSLLAMRVVSRLSRLFGTVLLLRSFFERPTVRAFAEYLVATEIEPGRTETVARALLRLRDLTPVERDRLRTNAGAGEFVGANQNVTEL